MLLSSRVTKVYIGEFIMPLRGGEHIIEATERENNLAVCLVMRLSGWHCSRQTVQGYLLCPCHDDESVISSPHFPVHSHYLSGAPILKSVANIYLYK